MKILKNGVGRPSNQVLKIRKIIYLGILIIVLLAVFLPIYILKIKSTNVNNIICSKNQIPDILKPYDKINNPKGMNQYGFENEKFYTYIVNSIGKNKKCENVLPKDLKMIKTIDLEDKKIKNFNGIQYLTSLEKLNLKYNEINEIDLSKNVNLVELKLGYNKIDNINLSNNKELRNLSLYGNNLVNVDLRGNKKLEKVNLSANKIKNIDISQNTNLKNLNIYGNKL